MAQQDSQESPQGPQSVPARYVRFGAFLADLERTELFQNGRRVKVQAKLFQALELLLRRAGDVVTREEVRCHLWPDTFLTNLDANVNTTINKLRQALGDSPESPVYIETIPRRGYSFLAAVQFSNSPSLATLEMPHQKIPAVAEVGGLGALWSSERFYVFARVVSLLFGGMILGALLTFVWFFSQGRYHRASSGASTSMSLAQYELYSSAGLACENQFNPRL
jgi:DNA-binding winged helix-turn-helix (wHTH) protein